MLVGVGLCIWGLGDILNERLQSKRIKEFKNDFEAAVKHGEPSWDEIKEIAATRYVTQNEIWKILRDVHREVLTGRDKELEPHKDIIKSYIEHYEKAQPFEGIPNDLRIHLERLREKFSENIELLDPLTSQIKDLVAVNQKERRQQKYYTIGGFFVGLLGLAFAFYTYFAEVHKSPVLQQNMEASQDSEQSSANKSIQPTQ